MATMFIHRATGSVYHSVGMTEVCQHPIYSDGTFDSECGDGTCLVDYPNELPRAVREFVDRVRHIELPKPR